MNSVPRILCLDVEMSDEFDYEGDSVTKLVDTYCERVGVRRFRAFLS